MKIYYKIFFISIISFIINVSGNKRDSLGIEISNNISIGTNGKVRHKITVAMANRYEHSTTKVNIYLQKNDSLLGGLL